MVIFRRQGEGRMTEALACAAGGESLMVYHKVKHPAWVLFLWKSIKELEPERAGAVKNDLVWSFSGDWARGQRK
jgi:hypothetical protein